MTVSIGPQLKDVSNRASYVETPFGLAGWRMKLLLHCGSWFNTWRSLNRSRLKKGLLLQVVVVQHPLGWAAAFLGSLLELLVEPAFGDLVLVEYEPANKPVSRRSKQT